jgi:hypothetical protein
VTIQIGRLTGLTGPMDWKNQGNVIAITGRYAAGSANAARTLRDQLLGYHLSLDEPVIPIVSSADSRLTGFYRIGSVDVPTPPVLLASNGVFEYAIQAERIGTYRSVQLESVLNGALMANANGIAAGTAEPFFAVPNTAIEWGLSTAFTQETRPAVRYDGTTADIAWLRMNPNFKALARFAMQPSLFYDGAVYLTGSNLGNHIIVGRQEAPDGTEWTIKNGLVSVSFGSSYFQLFWWDSTHTLETSAQMLVQGTTASTGIMRPLIGFAGSAVKIIRNAPEEVILRVPCYFDGTNGQAFSPAYFDISVRRGSRIVRIYMVTSASDTWLFGNAFAGVASIALTGGNVWTANDGFGNRVVIMTSQARTDDLVKGRFTMNASGTTFDCGVAMEKGGTASTNRDTAQSQIYQYHAAQAERMSVVAR